MNAIDMELLKELICAARWIADDRLERALDRLSLKSSLPPEVTEARDP